MALAPEDRQHARSIPKLLEVVPALADAHIVRTWTGIDGETPDAIPVLGASATTPGLFHAFGFSGHGFQLGPAVGEVLAELATRGSTPTPIEAFRVDRFTRQKVLPDVRRFAG